MSIQQLSKDEPPSSKDFDVDGFNKSSICQNTKLAMEKAFREIRLDGKINPRNEKEL